MSATTKPFLPGAAVRSIRPSIAIAACAALLLAPSAAAETTVADGFASAFFVSWSYDAGGTRSIEWIGSGIIWLLLLLSVGNIGLIGNLFLVHQRRAIAPEGVVSEVRRLMSQGKFREAIELTAREGSFFSRVLHAGLGEASLGLSAIVRRVEETSDELTLRMLRRVEHLNVLGQVSPMIGLFGTVYGMILAFRSIVASGGNADPVLLAAGIGTALITTFWGLVVAIPALSAYALIRNRIDELTGEATLQAEDLLNMLRARAAAKSGGES
ncbi:MAG: MotA/TolQ/ExbB proton channel family protein [Phycisphaerales bacterium]|nr:MotA/TolQ/ExbB proton channel family protein [Phycisphaerales bacterium]